MPIDDPDLEYFYNQSFEDDKDNYSELFKSILNIHGYKYNSGSLGKHTDVFKKFLPFANEQIINTVVMGKKWEESNKTETDKQKLLFRLMELSTDYEQTIKYELKSIIIKNQYKEKFVQKMIDSGKSNEVLKNPLERFKDINLSKEKELIDGVFEIILDQSPQHFKESDKISYNGSIREIKTSEYYSYKQRDSGKIFYEKI